MGIKIKICGLMRQEDIGFVNNYTPDYIGFIFAPSRRQITKEQAKALAIRLNTRIIRVGVFVDQPAEYIAELVSEEIIQYIQLHGNETNQYIENLRELLSDNNKCKIIKAIRVKSQDDIREADQCNSDLILFDSFSGGYAGGNGQTFDWSMIKNIKKPFFLAGGIDASNVCKAIDEVNPYGIDASSSLETNGWKDEMKINTFIHTIREYEGKGGYYE